MSRRSRSTSCRTPCAARAIDGRVYQAGRRASPRGNLIDCDPLVDSLEVRCPRLFLTLVVAACLAASGAQAITLPVETRTLRNGLRVLVHPDHSAPVVGSYIFFRTGSRNERRGTTGIAHLFEHMMFNGGKKFGPGVFDDTIEKNGGS